MHGKPLSALLQILRSNGVAKYRLTTKEKDGKETTVDLELGAAPAGRPAPRAINVSPEALDADPELHGEDDEDEEGDPRFLLERLERRHVAPGKRPHPSKNPVAS